MPVKVDTVAIKGQEVEITYNTATKVFEAEFAGSHHLAPTQDALVAKLRKAGDRQKPMAIPFTEIEEGWRGGRSNDKPKVRQGVLTGRHSGNKNLLVSYEDGGHDQLRYDSSVYVRLSDVQIEEYWTLFKAQKAAERALQLFKDTHKMRSPSAAVQAALENNDAEVAIHSAARGPDAASDDD